MFSHVLIGFCFKSDMKVLYHTLTTWECQSHQSAFPEWISMILWVIVVISILKINFMDNVFFFFKLKFLKVLFICLSSPVLEITIPWYFQIFHDRGKPHQCIFSPLLTLQPVTQSVFTAQETERQRHSLNLLYWLLHYITHQLFLCVTLWTTN